MAHETPDRPTIDEHPGLDNDEATDDGKMLTAEGSTGTDATVIPPTLEDHPGLDNDEAMDEGKQMTAEGSTGEAPRESDPA
jgi:hypothetical protein